MARFAFYNWIIPHPQHNFMNKRTLLSILSGLLLLAGCDTPITPYPTSSPEGLTLMDHPRSQVNAIYIAEGSDFSGFEKVMILTPEIAFKPGWQENINQTRPQNHVSPEDAARMIEVGKELMTMEFTRALQAGGYTITDEPGADVLGVKASLKDLEIYAPNANNAANPYSQTFTRGGGIATLILELSDSASGQILARVIDRDSGFDRANDAPSVRTSEDNIEDTRAAFAKRANLLANGLNLLKTGQLELTPRLPQ